MSFPLLFSHNEGERPVLICILIMCVCPMVRVIVEQYAANEHPLRKEQK